MLVIDITLTFAIAGRVLWGKGVVFYLNVDLYVVRIPNYETPEPLTLMSKPCTDCVDTIKEFGIRRIYYTTGNNQWMCDSCQTISSDHVSYGRRRYD